MFTSKDWFTICPAILPLKLFRINIYVRYIALTTCMIYFKGITDTLISSILYVRFKRL